MLKVRPIDIDTYPDNTAYLLRDGNGYRRRRATIDGKLKYY
jgi:hypothetical protein